MRTSSVLHLIGFALALFSYCNPIEAGSAEIPDSTTTPWQPVALEAEGGLQDRNLFNIDFERSGRSTNLSHVWIAASDGLYRYDGYEWAHYTRSNGLPSDLVRCVHVSKAGEIWVGTDRGAGVFTGSRFETRGSETGLAGPNVRRIEEDSEGFLWFCSDSWPKREAPGGIASYRDGRWRSYRKADGLPEEYVVSFFQSSSGRRYAATLNVVLELQGDRWVPSLTRPSDGSYPWGSSCFAETTNGVLFSTGTRLFLLQDGRWQTLPSSMLHQHGLITTREGVTMACANLEGDRKALIALGPQGWMPASEEFASHISYSEDLREAPDGSIWVVGFGSLVRWQHRNPSWREFPGIPQPRLVDARGRLWFGLGPRVDVPGSLMRFESNRWERLDPPRLDLLRDASGAVWGWTSNLVTRWENDTASDFDLSKLGLELIIKVLTDRKGQLWVVGMNSGAQVALATWADGRWTHIDLPSVTGRLPASGICPDREGLWALVESREGAFSIVHLGMRPVPPIDVPRSIVSLYGEGLVADSQDNLWVLGDAGLFRRKLGGSERWEEITGRPGRRISKAIEVGDSVWFLCDGATGGRSGIARFRAGEWEDLPMDSVRDLLPTDSGGAIALALGRFYFLSGESKIQAIPFDLPFAAIADSVVQDREKRYWVGAGGKVYVWGTDGVPPRSFLGASETNVLAGRDLQIEASAVERFLPRGARKDQMFSWRMDGGEWSAFGPTTKKSFSTTSLALGTHLVEVRAQDSGVDLEPVPARLAFFVHPIPLQSRPWFIPLLFGGIIIVSGLAAVTLRARLQVAAYAGQLEVRVAERNAQLLAELHRRQSITEALKISEERFSKVFAASPVVIAVSSYPDGRYVDVNPHFTELLGYTRDEVIGLRADDFGIWTHPEERATIIALLERGEIVRGVECTLQAKCGRHLTVLASVERVDLGGQPCLLFINHDITDRKNSERQLGTLSAWQKGVLDNAPYAIISVNPDGVIQSFNKAAEQMLGYYAQEVIGKTTPMIIHDEKEVAVRARELSLELNRSIEPGFEVFVAKARLGIQDESEWQYVRRNQERFPVRLSVSALRSSSGELTGFIGIAQDLSERRLFEERLRQAQKLEAVGLLSSGIAHDFNNILGAILGNVELATMDSQPGGPVANCLEEVRRAGVRAKHLIQQILAFGRQQPQERQTISLRGVVEEAVSLLRATIPSGVSLRVRIEQSAPMVFVDSSQIHQIIVNLCTNAWQSLEGASGSIDVSLEGTYLDARAASRLAGVKPGHFAKIEVRDTGKGMDVATLERIFEPFFTTKAPGKGTGLGLAVVHGIIQSHEGAMEVSSQLGKGSTFTIYLPATQRTLDTDELRRGAVRTGSGQHILYLDDEEPLLQLAERSLKRLGYRVSGFTQVAQALAAFRANPGDFALVITDYNIPGTSGLRVAQEIMQIRSDVPVLLSSGHVTDELKDRARKMGVRYVLHKPNTIEEFSKAVHLLISDFRQP